MATLQFGLEEIAAIAGIDFKILRDGMKEKDSEIYRAYFTGQLKAEAELRKSIYQMAKSGSTPAQKQFSDLIAQNKIKPKK